MLHAEGALEGGSFAQMDAGEGMIDVVIWGFWGICCCVWLFVVQQLLFLPPTENSVSGVPLDQRALAGLVVRDRHTNSAGRVRVP